MNSAKCKLESNHHSKYSGQNTASVYARYSTYWCSEVHVDIPLSPTSLYNLYLYVQNIYLAASNSCHGSI